jgi:hypothetical protein
MKEEIRITPHSIELIIDGSQSDPITPLTPKEKEHLQRVRERLIKQGLMRPPAQATQETSPESH